MIINLSPQRRDEALEATRIGDRLTITEKSITSTDEEGVHTYEVASTFELDFTALPDGATLPNDAIDCEWIAGDVERIDGVLHITLLLPHVHDASEAARFPEPIVNPNDGVVELPK